jgi:hypothetical protein
LPPGTSAPLSLALEVNKSVVKLTKLRCKSQDFFTNICQDESKNIAPPRPMSFFRQYVAPVIVVLLFLVALIAVSARIFLPDDLAQPAPVSELTAPQTTVAASKPRSYLSVLVNGLPDDLALSAQL